MVRNWQPPIKTYPCSVTSSSSSGAASSKTANLPSSADSAEIIINEAALAAFGLKEPIGHTMEVFYGDGPRKIVGVVKDFHFQSLHENVKPMALRLTPSYNDAIVTRIKAGTEKETIAAIGALYARYHPGFPFEYRFLDDDFQAQYLAEKRISLLSRYFGGLATELRRSCFATLLPRS